MDETLLASVTDLANDVIRSGKPISRNDIIDLIEMIIDQDNKLDYINAYLDLFPAVKQKVLDDINSYL